MVLEFAFWPPEINSALMFAGAGSGSLFSAASAWEELASNLSASASSFGSVISDLTSGNWTGPSAEAMAQAAGPYLQWLSTAVGHAEGAAMQARAAATAFETAMMATVHPTAVTANRMTLMTLIATNFLGQNTPAIFATELLYMEMWAQDVAAMFGYHAGATSVASSLPSISAAPTGLAGLVTAPLSDAASSAGSFLGSGFSSFIGMAEAAVAQMSSLFSAGGPVSSLVSAAQVGLAPASIVLSPVLSLTQGAAPAATVAASTESLAAAPGLVGSTAPVMPALPGTGGFGSAMTVGLGTARFVGAISVPPTWQGAAPARIVTAAISGLEGATPGLPAGTTGPTGVPVMSAASAGAAARPAIPGRGGSRATHVVQSRPRVVPRTEVG